MREIYIRCIHCGDVYNCVLSGASPDRAHTNHDYCPKCWEAIKTTLKAIPKVRDCDWVPCEDSTITEKMLLEHREKEEKRQEAELRKRNSFALIGRPVGLPLYEIREDGSVGQCFHTELVYYNEVLYSISGRERCIEMLMETECATGKILGPWKALRY